ncbi:MAG: ribosome biogenesis GTPase Der [Phycisphaeraceae bacterium]|jgi:GTP-binding protein
MPLPKIAIVGRPNVGKSSLMNRLAGRKISIVDPTAGVTRDRVSTTIELSTEGEEPNKALLIDTGGYGIEDSQQLTAEVEQQIASGLADADLVLFLVDAQSGIVPLDQTVAQVLRTSAGDKPVVLVANKVDADNLEPAAYDAMQLGFGEPVMISATTKHNLGELYRVINQRIDFDQFDASEESDDDSGVLVAVVGKRNAGKSTLVNALAGEERVIVSEKEGTTRDSVDVRCEIDDKVFTLIDTAGVRKTKSLAGDIEYYSQHRSLRSVRRADVCLLLVDSSVPISQVDHQLVNEINKHYRPTVVVINKWDLAEQEHTQDEYVEYLDDALKGLTFAPIVFTSALAGEGMREAVALALNLYEQSNHRMGTSELNRAIEEIANERGPSSKSGKHAKMYYATQTGVNPPTVVLFVNDADLFDRNYQQYLINRMRDTVAFSEVPIRLFVRGKDKMTPEQRKDLKASSKF